MELSITTLSENTANYGYLAEWGLSILIEVNETRILMDTGLSFSAAHNAQLMGIDLSTIDYIVLSHGHADHTGGLREVLKIKGEVEVIAHPDIWAAKHVQRNQEEVQYNGIPFLREELESRGARFKFVRDPAHITEHIMTTGEIAIIRGIFAQRSYSSFHNLFLLRPAPTCFLQIQRENCRSWHFIHC